MSWVVIIGRDGRGGSGCRLGRWGREGLFNCVVIIGRGGGGGDEESEESSVDRNGDEDDGDGDGYLLLLERFRGGEGGPNGGG